MALNWLEGLNCHEASLSSPINNFSILLKLASCVWLTNSSYEKLKHKLATLLDPKFDLFKAVAIFG